MKILQKFEYTWPEGVTPILFQNWAATLPQAEQDEFALASDRQTEIRQQWVDDGLIEKVPGTGYIWKDQATFDVNKPVVDPTWQKYWNRWIEETGVTFSYSISEN